MRQIVRQMNTHKAFKPLSWLHVIKLIICTFYITNQVGASSYSSRGGSIATSKHILSTGVTNLRVALAGGIAGATGTLVLYPLDTAKTLRQSNPEKYRDVRMALQEMIQGHAGKYNNIGMQQAYSGVLSAVIFSIPSSALYFGAYESMKQFLNKKFENKSIKTRLAIHSIAAASGNIASSIIFVPKEYIKQQMQASKGQLAMVDVVKQTLQRRGIQGFYRSYTSTIMRNIPSAILRFAIYEELKRTFDNDNQSNLPLYFMQGALAGAISSGLMTPLDVVKTRIATNTIPNHLSVLQGIQYISKHHGIRNGLYAGARTRMIWSSAFSAIGFGTFEISKKILGVSDH